MGKVIPDPIQREDYLASRKQKLSVRTVPDSDLFFWGVFFIVPLHEMIM